MQEELSKLIENFQLSCNNGEILTKTLKYLVAVLELVAAFGPSHAGRKPEEAESGATSRATSATGATTTKDFCIRFFSFLVAFLRLAEVIKEPAAFIKE